ncbi:MAG: TetR/AcrR family transcriptional regulator [Glaciihabitans sp.]|nr:TetR/AcrR family transcriptional regulator [Glaciihabitans sp.]
MVRWMVETAAKKASPRQKLLAAADELFYNEGIRSVGIDRVIERAGVAKGSLYYNFGSKDDLIKEYLLGRHAAWTARIDAAIAAQSDPKSRVLAVFDVLGELFAEPDYRGCAFMNAVAEAPEGGPELAAAANFRAWLHGMFDDLVTALGAQNPSLVAGQLVILYDGAVSAAQMDSSPAAAQTAKTLAAMVLESR